MSPLIGRLKTLFDWLKTLGKNNTIGIAPNTKRVNSIFCGFLIAENNGKQ